eukprot:CAMPEP_0206329388 /NCGR_PEP_ID=MMETSP0106_2-20121207/23171_1 /ASSEMBLY_ACC=CAM_ASM_000206 /TAXON_ID=81532 /ORGANISM="Acanthoeca-like sp., Strain 10tr" /LENGTH=125 /DNA_ID=CAMNT_0053762101 /DNA_START=178 /DNA_END=556 /DNA_ORIENTATION=-
MSVAFSANTDGLQHSTVAKLPADDSRSNSVALLLALGLMHRRKCGREASISVRRLSSESLNDPTTVAGRLPPRLVLRPPGAAPPLLLRTLDEAADRDALMLRLLPKIREVIEANRDLGRSLFSAL